LRAGFAATFVITSMATVVLVSFVGEWV